MPTTDTNCTPLTLDLRLLRRLFKLVPRGHRAARAVWRRRLQRLGPVRLRTKFGFEILLDSADHIGWAIIMHGNWEPAVTALVRSVVKDDDVFVDVGANYGWHSLCAAALLRSGAGRVVAYEPQEKLCQLLRGSAELSNLTNLSVVQAAVSDHSSWGALQLPRADRTELATVRVTENQSNGVRIVALDDQFRDLPAPTVIKIDAEGFELRVLRGMRSLVKLDSPRCLIIEVHPPLMAGLGDDPRELYEALRHHGFGVFLIRDNGQLRPVSEPNSLETAALRSGCCNILASRAQR